MLFWETQHSLVEGGGLKEASARTEQSLCSLLKSLYSREELGRPCTFGLKQKFPAASPAKVFM